MPPRIKDSYIHQKKHHHQKSTTAVDYPLNPIQIPNQNHSQLDHKISYQQAEPKIVTVVRFQKGNYHKPQQNQQEYNQISKGHNLLRNNHLHKDHHKFYQHKLQFPQEDNLYPNGRNLQKHPSIQLHQNLIIFIIQKLKEIRKFLIFSIRRIHKHLKFRGQKQMFYPLEIQPPATQ